MSFTQLPHHLADAIRTMVVDGDESAALHRIVAVACQEIAGADCAGITSLESTGLETLIATDPRVVLADQEQSRTGEGPCVSPGTAEPLTIICDDLADDDRWPRFGRAAADLGLCSAIFFKLVRGRTTIGSLNVYSARHGAFTDDARHSGSLLAAHAAIVLAASRQQANLHLALQTRDVIGQAKGILMERHRYNEHQAFDALIASSQQTKRKLRDVAEHLRTTGELPGGSDGGSQR